METLKESLFSKKNLDNKRNKYGITENDMIDDLEGFPVGVVVRMMEEQEAQGNESDVAVFQEDNEADTLIDGFDWDATEARSDFWCDVIGNKNFNRFFKRYPEYKKYN